MEDLDLSQNKTKPTELHADDFLASIDDDERRADCQAIRQVMERVTGEPAVMWGSSIVGFGTYHYRYESGREGDWALTGFSPRKKDTSVYLMASGPDQAGLLDQLGRHKMGKSCLYIRKLSDIDLGVLEKLITGSVNEVRRRYG